METLWQDIRYGFRVLARNPGFAAVIIVVLALGIGATTAMLSVIDAVLLRPCPYKDAHRLACLYETNNPVRNQRDFTSLARFRDWCEQQAVFEEVVGADQWNGIVRVANRAERSRGFFVSEGFFSLLDARPMLGRTFVPEEHAAGGQRVVVLSYDHWRHWFAGDPNVLGKTLILNNQVCTVVGVLSKGFRWVFQDIACGLWMPLSLDGVEDGRRGLQAIARLKTGVTIGQAQAQMDLIAERLARLYPETNANSGIQVVPINEDYARQTAGSGKPRILMILLGVVAAVLLIACVHVANLLIARSVAREQEIAVRMALGANRLRIARQSLTESILLATGGGLVGLGLARLGVGVLSAWRSRSIPWYMEGDSSGAIPWFVQVHVDARVLLYMVGLSLLTCMLFGTLPALGAGRVNVNQRLSAAGTRMTSARAQSLRALLVIGDIATAFVLLAGAGLLINSYLRVLHADRRFDPTNILAAEIAFDWRLGPEPAQRLVVFEEALRRTRALPGVQGATAASCSPVSGSYSSPSFQIEGHASPADGVSISQTDIFPDYFRVLRIPLLRGRFFTEHDDKATAAVVIVNEALARRFWPNEEALGKHMTRVARRDTKAAVYEVIGVVANVWHSRYTLDEPEVYTPYLQSGYPPEVCLMIRTSSSPAALTTAVRRELAAAAEGAVIDHVGPLGERIADLFASERSNTLFLSVFAAGALLLASIGVYGTTAYAVSWRTREIGIRMALGARTTDVLRTMMGQGLRLTLIGILIGLIAAGLLTRVISSLLHGISPTDPLTFACVTLLLAGTALFASYLPARRAARVDPIVALRYE